VNRNILISLLFAACAAVAILIISPSVGIAQPSGASEDKLDSAKKHMERGQELYMQKKYAEAAEAFAAAYAVQPYAAFIYNEAVCHQKLGENEQALDLFRKYLRVDPSAPDANKVRDRIRRIEEAMAPPTPPAADADAGADAGEAGADAGVSPPPPRDAGKTIVEEQGPDLMKSLVMIESEPPNAPVSVYYRTSPSVAPYEFGKPNPGWEKVTTGRTPLNATLELGRYHIVMEPFEDFHQSETDIDVAAGHIHKFKANLRQGEFMAFLRVTSPTPGARIYVDDPPPHEKPPWGITPHEGLIGLGDHRIWVAKNGFETSSRTFSVAHGEEREELIELVRINKGIVRFEGNAAAIEVAVDGKPLGTYNPGAPLQIELPSGRHRVTATADDRKELDAEFEVPRGQVLPIDLVMMPTTPRGAAWTQAAVSLAFLGGGFALRIQSDNIYDDILADSEAGTLTESDDRYTKGKIYAISSTASFGISGALAALSAYNFIKDPTPESGLRRGTPTDYPDEASAEPGAPSPQDRKLVPAKPPPTPKAARPEPSSAFSSISVLPAHDMHGAGLMLQGRF